VPALITGSQGLAMQQQLNFSRDMEREADRIGFGVMSAAGFEPQGFVSMFDKLQQAARLNDNGAYPYLRTHPMTTERAADMQSRIQLAGRTPPATTPGPRARRGPGASDCQRWRGRAARVGRGVRQLAALRLATRAPGRRPLCRRGRRPGSCVTQRR
jgi:predicted Zn-dependent protease